MGGLSIWHWIIVLVVVILLFGTKKLPGLGSDVGKAIRGFKKAMNEDEGGANPKLEADPKNDSTTQSSNKDQVR